LTYTIVDGALPDGLALGADGSWSGDVAGVTGTYTVTVQACDPSGACASQVLSLVYEAGVLDDSAVLPDTSTVAPATQGSASSDLWLLVVALLASASSLVLAWRRVPYRDDVMRS
jgi:hypothetical protein